MTSFDVGVSLASIVESYRTYDESHIKIIKQFVQNGEWEDSYLPSITGDYLELIFDTAVKADNMAAMEAVYSKKRPSNFHRLSIYMIKKDDLDSLLSIIPNFRKADTRAFAVACQYNNQRIVEALIDKNNKIMLNLGLATAVRYNHRNLVRLIVGAGAETRGAITQCIGKDIPDMLDEIISLIDPSEEDIDSMIIESIDHYCPEVFNYLSNRWGLSLKCHDYLLCSWSIDLAEIAIRNHKLDLNYILSKGVKNRHSREIMALLKKYDNYPGYYLLFNIIDMDKF